MSAVIDRASAEQSASRFDRIVAHRQARAAKLTAITKLRMDVERLVKTEADAVLVMRGLSTAAANADKRLGGTAMAVIVDRLDELCDEMDGAR